MSGAPSWYELDPPARWKAGATLPSDGQERPFYHDCAGCLAKEPEIALAHTEPGMPGKWMVIKRRGPKGREEHYPALFCAPCRDRIRAGGPTCISTVPAPCSPTTKEGRPS